jgi:hypothetical protein
LRHRFVVGGYVRKRVTLRISKGLRAVALAAGISRRVYSDTRVIFITFIAIYIALAEKIGTPLITLEIHRKFCVHANRVIQFSMNSLFKVLSDGTRPMPKGPL